MTVKVGMVAYTSEQGLGRMAKQFYDAGLVTEVLAFRHSSRPSHMEWYPPGTRELVNRPFSGPVIDEWLKKIQVCLFFETPFDWSFITYCRRRGVKTALIPMYEWTPSTWTHKPDLLVNPSLLDQKYFPEGVFIPVPVETKHWKLRTTASRFLHNAGNVGCKEHKGTRQLLEAIRFVKNPDFRLTVRAQDDRALSSIVKQTPSAKDPRVAISYGDVPYETLWDGHDVLVAPEKLNGLSLPLQEAFAAGMLVMTSDRFPHNTWLPTAPLIKVSRYEKARQSAGCLEFDLAIVEPEVVAATIDSWVGRDITLFNNIGKVWAEEHSWPALLPRYQKVFENLVKGIPQ
jgi:hypothetical protein